MDMGVDIVVIKHEEMRALVVMAFVLLVAKLQQQKPIVLNLKNKFMKQLVGQVTVEEKNEIQTLFERRNGLNELAKIVTAENEALYEKLVKDMGETGAKFQNWWDTMAQKYQWESVEGGNWEINFDTCEIFLISNN